ncbi:MAG TPA: SRPBCC family protein [Gemmatimonadaceae bacterium]|nr:SRPBCC family protein [Gemmatimonadaceae bacterium]
MIAIETSVEIAAPPAVVWARLCDADMPATAPCEFRLGALGPPQPLRCELPTGVGGIGQERRCVTTRGIVTQRITAWVEAEHLAFELVAEAAGLGAHVQAMKDDFWLTPLGPARTRLTRRTALVPRRPCPRLRGLALRVAVRRVHRFTMRGFAAAAVAAV